MKDELQRRIENELHGRVLAAERAFLEARFSVTSAPSGTGPAWAHDTGGSVEQTCREAYRVALKNFSQFLFRKELPSAQYFLVPLLTRAMEATHASFGNIQWLDGSRQVLKIAAHCGFDRPFLDFFEDVADERGSSCGMAFKTSQRVIVADVRESPIFAETAALRVLLRAGVKACQSTPLVSPTGALIGMLNTHYSEPTVPSKNDLAAIDELAPSIAAFLAADAIRGSKPAP